MNTEKAKPNSRKGGTKNTSNNTHSTLEKIQSAVLEELLSLWRVSKDEYLKNALDYMKKSAIMAQKRYFGESVTVLGPPAAGKTTLLKLLADRRISSEALSAYSKTEFESHPSIPVEFKLHFDSSESILFRFKIKKNSDVGGEEYVRTQHWMEAVSGSAIIIYMIDGARIIDCDSGDYRTRILSDFDWIRDHHQQLHENFSVVFVFNKIDNMCNVENYAEFSRENSHYIEDLKNDIIKRWPSHLKSHVKGGIFLSLLNPGLRSFTLNALVSCFVGDDLMGLFKEKEKEA